MQEIDSNRYFPEEETINFKKYLYLILSRWYWFVISFVIAGTVVYLINRYSDEVYEVSSSIIISDEASSMTGVDNIIQQLGLYRRQRRKDIANEMEILKSYQLTYRTMKELDFDVSVIAVGRRGIKEMELYKSGPFIVNIDTLTGFPTGTPVYITLLSNKEYLVEIADHEGYKKKMLFGEQFHEFGYNFSLQLRNPSQFQYDPEASNKYYFIKNDINSLTNKYRNKLKLNQRDEKGSVIVLSTSGPVPEKEVDFQNKFLEVYIEMELEEKNQIAENTIKFIEQQLKGISDSLAVDETKLQNFRVNNNVIDLSKEGTRLFEKYGEIQNDKVEIMVQINYLDFILNYIKTHPDDEDFVLPVSTFVDNANLTAMIQKLNDLYMQKRMAGFTAKQINPVYAKIDQEIADAKKLILEMTQSSKALAEQQLQETNTRLAEVNSKILKLPEKERALLKIERRFNLNDNLYTFLLEKRAEAGIAKASNVSSNSILDKARVQNAQLIAPKKKMNRLIGLFMGFAFPLGIIILLEMLNNKIVDKDDIVSKTRVPLISVVGHNYGKTEIPVFEQPKSSLAESFRSLRTNLDYFISHEHEKVVSITSAVSGEGKSFVAINLATILAMAGKKVLLIGLDLRKPKIHRVFNISNETGISNYLIHKASSNEILYETNIDNLTIIPSGPVPPNPAELLETDTMSKLMKKLKSSFDMVIVDTPPVGIVTDALLINKYSDATIFVVRQNYSKKEVLNLVDELYHKHTMSSLGILVNDLKQTKGYGSGYHFGYGYGYGYASQYKHSYYTDDFEHTGWWSKMMKRIRKS